MSFSGLCLSCCSGITRTAFLVVALPLLLAGGLFSEIANQLVHQSVKHLEYAAMEEATGWELQAQADRNIATAALDQTEAGDLEAHAAAMEEKASGEEGGSGSQGGEGEGEGEGGGEAGGEAGGETGGAGEAAGGAVEEGGAAGFDSAAEVAAAVHEVAAAAEGAGAAAASEASAAGAGAAGAAAAEAAVDAAAVGTAGAAGVSAGSAAALAGAAGVVAVSAPKVAKGLESQYAMMGDEVQAVRDQSLAEEKEAEAAGLEASVPVYEAGSASAEAAAARSLAIAAGFLATSQVFQVAALICEAPVAVAVLVRWSLSAAGGTLCAKTPEGFGLGHWTSLGITRLSMALGVSALLLGAWGDSVLVAASRHDHNGVFDALERIPDLVAKAKGNSASSRSGTDAPPAAGTNTSEVSVQSSRLLLRRLDQSLSEELYHEAGDLLKEAGQKTGEAAKQTQDFLHKESLGVAKKWGERKPHTGTTTVPPQTTAPPPVTQSAVAEALAAFVENAMFWLRAMLEAFLLTTLLFMIVEFGIGIGRHGSVFPAVTDALNHWLYCTATVVAIWLLSVMLSVQLRPYALRALNAHDNVPFRSLGCGLIGISLLAGLVHAHLLRRSRGGTCSYSEVGTSEAATDPSAPGAASGFTTAAYLCLASVTFAFGFLLEAIEGPAFSSALGGAYHSYQKTQYLLPLAPKLWPVIESNYHTVMTRIAVLIGVLVLALICAGAGIVGFLNTGKASAIWTRDHRDPRAPLE